MTASRTEGKPVFREVVAVVGTGPTGAAVARRLAVGKRLLLADLRQDALDIFADTMRSQGHDVFTQLVDVRSPSSVHDLAVRAAGLGTVRHLVHTAAVWPDEASAEDIIDVNLIGAALVLEAFSEVISENGSGLVVTGRSTCRPTTVLDAELLHRIANVDVSELIELALAYLATAGAANTTSGSAADAACSLAAHVTLLRTRLTAARWLSKNSRINLIDSGVVVPSTRLGLPGGEQHAELVLRATGGHGVSRGTPEDIACAAEFLLGPLASFITGSELVVDGGLNARTFAADAPSRAHAGARH